MEPLGGVRTTVVARPKTTLLQLIIYVLFALGPLAGNVIQVLFNKLALDLSTTPDALLVSIPAFMVPFAIVQLFSGTISEIKGRVPVIIVGLAIFGAGMLLATISVVLIPYLIANALGGIGFGFVNPVLIALMTDITPRGPGIAKKMGYLIACANLSVGLGPFIAAQFAIASWRLVYVLFLLITIASLVMLPLARPRTAAVTNHDDIRNLGSQLLREIRRPVVLSMIVSAFLTGHSMLATTIWTSRFVAEPGLGHISPTLFGGILAITGIAGFASAVAFGFLIKRKGPRTALFTGYFLMVVGLLVLIATGDVSRTNNAPFLLTGLVLVMIASGGFFPVVIFFSQTVKPDRRGALAGLSTFGYFTGIALATYTYAPAFAWGITAVYVAILIVGCILLLSMFCLISLARKQSL